MSSKLWLSAICLTIIVNSDGFLKMGLSGYVAGSMNYIRMTAIFLLILTLILVPVLLNGTMARKQLQVIALGIVGSAMVIAFSTRGSVMRGSYDAMCYMTFFLILSMGYNRGLRNVLDWSRVFQLTFYLSVGLMLVAMLAGAHLDPLGRLSGIFPTSSIFATAFALIFLGIVKHRNVSPTLFLATVALIGFSGTRAALLQVFAILSRTISLRRGNMALRLLVLVGVIGGAYFLGQDSLEALADMRVLSVSDLESGSASTRLLWYYNGWRYLVETAFLGGGGAGFSYAMNWGYLMHFDLMRIWIDYGVLPFAILLLTPLAVCWSTARSEWWIYYAMAFIAPGFHNALQAPELLVLSAAVMTLPRTILLEQPAVMPPAADDSRYPPRVAESHPVQMETRTNTPYERWQTGANKDSKL